MAKHQEANPKNGGGGSSGTDGSMVSTSSSFPSANNNDEAMAPAAQLKYEEGRKRKGKMLAADQPDAPLQPQVQKLMGDAIRAQVTQSNADTLPFTSVKDIVFGDLPITDKLRDILGSVSPVCVHEKKMWSSDRDKVQNRLLISCKNKKKGSKCSNEHHEVIPFAKMFTQKEKTIVHEADEKRQEEKKLLRNNESKEEKRERTERKRKRKEKEKENTEADKPGLDVQAYDRNGELYHMKCGFLTSVTAYRIFGKGWANFLKKNNLLVEKTGKKKGRKGKNRSPKEESCETPSRSSSLEPNGNPPKQELDNVRIEVWAFRSRKLGLGCTEQTEGALGLVLLHYREEDEAKHVDADRAGTEEPHGSEDDVMGQEVSDHQGAAMPNMGVPYVQNEVVMVEPVNAPEVALPNVVAQAPVDVPEVALAPVVEAPVDVPVGALPAIVEAAGPQGEAAALVDMIGFTPSPIEWEAVESLLLLGRPKEKMLEADGGGGRCISPTR
jgi:hypothetical protein